MNVDQIVCPIFETGPMNHRNGEGSIIELRDGRLFLAYSHYYTGADDWDAGDIRGKTSEDGGVTWSPSFPILQNISRYNMNRVSLIRMPELWDVAYTERPLIGMTFASFNQCYDSRIYIMVSADEGQTWCERTLINQTGLLGMMNVRSDTALVLKSGRIIVPTYALLGKLRASFMYFSDDGGMIWQRGRGEISVDFANPDDGLVFASSDFQEPAVAECVDGRLICLGRTKMGQLYKSYSSDSGFTWTDAEPTGLASSLSPASVATIPRTGDLLCVWNQASAQEIGDGLGRMRLSLAISKDNGETWAHFKNLESLDDVVRVEPFDGAVDTVSEQNALKARKALKAPTRRNTTQQFPEEVINRYPRWPGYIHNDYPQVTFTSTGNVIIGYSVSDYEIAGLTIGLKLVIRPIEWLYT